MSRRHAPSSSDSSSAPTSTSTSGSSAPTRPDPGGWTAALRSVRWLDGTRLELVGWALVAGQEPELPTVLVAGIDVATEPAADDDVRRDVNVVVGDATRDLTASCFRAVLDLEPALDAAAGTTYPVRLRVGTAEGPFRQVFRGGSAGRLLRTIRAGRQLEPRWADDGLTIGVRRPRVLATDVRLADGAVRLPAGTLRHALWERDGARVPAEVQTGQEGVRVTPPPFVSFDAPAGGGRWTLRSTDRSAAGEAVRLSTGGDLVLTDGATTVELSPTGVITARAVGSVLVDRVVVSDDGLEIGGPGAVPHLELSGLRTTVGVEPLATVTGWSATVDLVTDGLALPSGEYALQAPDRPVLLTGADDALGRWVHRPLIRVRPERSAGGLRLRVRPPVDLEGWGPWAAAGLDARWAAGPDRPCDAVYLESFTGRRVADNPLAIRHELALRHPGLRRVWGVADGSVAVPEGDERVILGTAAWREIRATARTLVTNDWLHGPPPREFQRILQTWHGTPLKRLALDRGDRDATFVAELRTEVAGWDVLLSQSPYMTAVLRRAYDFGGEVVELGYPRNDLLHGGPEPTRTAVRAALGVAAGERVLLYAPTWRDDDRRLVRLLDLSALTARLGPGWTVLVRGHTENIAHDQDVSRSFVEAVDRVHDVTLWPVVEELFAAADVLVTDYSSVMFDFAVTGRPLVFFVPDLADYRAGRGWYFDLAEQAPGPLVDTLDALVDAVTDVVDEPNRWAAAYTAWRERYVPDDDGRASERVVHRLWG